MALLDQCASECATISTLAKSYELKCVTPTKMQYGFQYYSLLSNAIDISTLDNTIETWCTVAEDGNNCISPCGKVELGTPSPTTSTDENNCGVTTVVENVWNITFSTYSADEEGLTHCKYYEDLMTNPCQKIIIYDCYGNPYLTKEWRNYINGVTTVAPTTSPGYSFSITQPPYQSNGDGNKVVWNFGIEIKTDATDILCPIKFPGLLECLKDQLATPATGS